MMVVWVWAMLRLIRIPDASAGGKPATIMRAYRICLGHHHQILNQRQIHHRPPNLQGRARAHARVRILG
ncbi:hypothetical protein D3M95_10825 [Corynebacterium falsenii]|uniref:Uncharacterized protein n=1 Tax=Corynebacterium falsenii TaxID=108486 RepID=A0A418Q4N2_9CORY|nr:hypothetical protein D3M95_10825 [Corynebacterium falsenii]